MPVNYAADERRECEFRLEAAKDMLELSTERFQRVALGGRREAKEEAYSDLRFARVRFLSAIAAYQEVLQSST